MDYGPQMWGSPWAAALGTRVSIHRSAGTDEGGKDLPVSRGRTRAMPMCRRDGCCFSTFKEEREHTQNPDEVSRVPSHTCPPVA